VSFTSVEYLFFLLVAIAVCSSIPRRLQPLSILLLSCAFYAFWDVRALIPLGGAVLLAYGSALGIEKAGREGVRKGLAFGSVTLLVATLLLLKDLPKSSRPSDWLVPLGISYYTFKLVSYVLDVFWGKQRAERDLIALASYALFFPQIVAGPIQRSADYLIQVRTPEPLSRARLMRGTGRLALGLFKKLVIADHIGITLNAVYGQVHAYSGAPLLCAFYLFPIQLYADFSGLTDIAIGSALMLGIESPENFDHPFSATNISEYWRRWHMSLTTWTVDYVLTPLRMATRNWNRIGLVFSIFANMMTIALWHGIAWTYFSFGLVHSAFVSVDALTLKTRKTFFRANPAWKAWAGWGGSILTFHLVAFGMVFWRAKTVSDAFWILRHMWVPLGALTSDVAQLVLSGAWHSLVIGMAAYTLLELAEKCRLKMPVIHDLQASARWLRWSVYAVSSLALVVGLLLMFIHGSVREPFLYEVF
jgi:alginate O-acetyltransferase complex protein AlgI